MHMHRNSRKQAEAGASFVSTDNAMPGIAARHAWAWN